MLTFTDAMQADRNAILRRRVRSGSFFLNIEMIAEKHRFVNSQGEIIYKL
jgi:hypothetical protein